MKRTLKCACLLLSALLLFGCGKKTAENPAEKSPENDEKLVEELTKYHWIDLYRGTFIYDFAEDGTYQIYAYRDSTWETSDSWVPNPNYMEEILETEGSWQLEGDTITLMDSTKEKEITAEIYLKNSDGYDEYQPNIYAGNAFIYESTYVEPDEEEGPLTTSAFTLLRLGEKEELPQTSSPINSWRGVYVYDDGSYGEILIVEASDDTSVTGQYIYAEASGDYGIRDFKWEISKENPRLAKEPFQNGTDYVTYEPGDNELIAKYPKGWHEDRHFVYRSSVEDMMEVIKHPMLNHTESTSAATPFYGIWTMGSQSETDAIQAADTLKSQGFDAKVYLTTDWSNLNPEPWYVVSAGEYASETEANNALNAVKNAGYSTAYVKYTGDYIK